MMQSCQCLAGCCLFFSGSESRYQMIYLVLEALKGGFWLTLFTKILKFVDYVVVFK